MNMGIGNLRTGIFNIADMAIMAGIGIILVRIPLSPEDAKRK
jgi:lipoprotein signal peptidase